MTREQLLIVVVVLAAVFVLYVLFGRRKRTGAPVFKDPRERLRWALGKTRGGLLDGLKRSLGGKIDEDVLGSLEEILLATDIGVQTTHKLLDGLKQAYREGKLKDQRDVLMFLRQELVRRLGGEAPRLIEAPKPPTVILVAGVNGVGKTTSIAKLTQHLAEQGKRVLLCASDTFRAAAIDQLRTWAERLGVEIQQGQHGQDPASVAHDAHEKAQARGFDYLIVDTAGRLHTQQNLMQELSKIARVGKKFIPESPHEVLLVIDATTGQNGVRQAAAFKQVVDVTGIILSKLDGTAKGGIVVVIREELGIPVKFVGLGEQATDLAPFDAQQFVDGLLPLD